MVLGNEVIGDIDGQAGMILHIIPESSIHLNSYIDLRKAKLNDKLDLFSPPNKRTSKLGRVDFNMDGLLVYYKPIGSPNNSTAQIFHNGIIEVLEFRLMNMWDEYNKKTFIFDWTVIEKTLAERLYNYSVLLQEMNISKPYYIFLTLFNVKGRQSLWDFDSYPEKPLSRNIIKLAPGFILEEEFEKEIAPILNSFANTFGMEKSTMYFDDGRPNPFKFDFI